MAKPTNARFEFRKNVAQPTEHRPRRGRCHSSRPKEDQGSDRADRSAVDQLRGHDGSIQGLHGVVRGLGTSSHKPSQLHHNGDGTNRAERYGIRPLPDSLGQNIGAEEHREVSVRTPTPRSETYVVMDRTESRHRLPTRRRAHTITRTSATRRCTRRGRGLRGSQRTYSRWSRGT